MTLALCLLTLATLSAATAAAQSATLPSNQPPPRSAPPSSAPSVNLDKPVAAEGRPFNSQELRFRIIFPNDPKVYPNDPKTKSETTTLFEALSKDETYVIRVLVITLDKEAAQRDPGTYFHEFNQGMKLGDAHLTDCQPGIVSGAPAERCDLTKYATNGLMLIVRRGGAAYFVSGEQERGNFNDALIKAAVGSFRLLPEYETFTFADQNFRADFPTRPKLSELGGGWVVKAYAGRERYMTMVAIDDLTDAQAAAAPATLWTALEQGFEQSLAENHVRLTECVAVEFIGGYAAHHCQYDDDKNTGKLLLVRRDKKLYTILANQPKGNGSDTEVDAFARSFKFLK